MHNTDAEQQKPVNELDTGEGVREAVRMIRELYPVVKKIEQRQSTSIKIWAWFKGLLTKASEEAKQIRID